MNELRILPAIALLSISSMAQEDPPPWPILKPSKETAPVPNTKPLDWKGDLSRKLIEANDRFLDRQILEAKEDRPLLWNKDYSSPEAYTKSVAPNREHLIKMLGLERDARPENPRLEWSGVVSTGPHTPFMPGVALSEVRWKAFGGVYAYGLLLSPMEMRSTGLSDLPHADIVVIPDADQSPEALAGRLKDEGTTAFALQLARTGCRVLIPSLISRNENKWTLTNREWLHRSAFMQGRTLTTYDLHKVISGVECLLAMQKEEARDKKIGVIGYGEGGNLAMLAAAVDPRIDACLSAGSFGPREALWTEPVERNIFGLLTEFGDAEIASLIHPRYFFASGGHYPHFAYRADEEGQLEIEESYTKKKGKPAFLPQVSRKQFDAECALLRNTIPKPNAGSFESAYRENEELVALEDLRKFLAALKVNSPELPADFHVPHPNQDVMTSRMAAREATQIAEIESHNQLLLVDAARVRKEYLKDLKTDSLEAFEKTVEPYREKFRTEVIGDFEIPLAPANARTRPYEEGPNTISYEVVLDVFAENDGEDRVIAYGILTFPKYFDPESGEKRPVVVCQHGLEGTPQDVTSEAKYKAYKAFATRLAERGFITFAPQNGYKYFDLFRMQQFKAQSIGKTLFSIIVPQHQQITNWLADQPFVDKDRIAFYGLSYGGKSAMRIPPLVDRYCLSICSADFNEWVWKNAATDPASLRYSYANKGEYEIFEWNLGGTFNYAEMAALICPRPFMVERGHFDGVGSDESVAYEYAKVQNLYQARLGIGDRCEIEWFVGPHSINGEGTYRFLHKHLDWPEPK